MTRNGWRLHVSFPIVGVLSSVKHVTVPILVVPKLCPKLWCAITETYGNPNWTSVVLKIDYAKDIGHNMKNLKNTLIVNDVPTDLALQEYSRQNYAFKRLKSFRGYHIPWKVPHVQAFLLIRSKAYRAGYQTTPRMTFWKRTLVFDYLMCPWSVTGPEEHFCDLPHSTPVKSYETFSK